MARAFSNYYPDTLIPGTINASNSALLSCHNGVQAVMSQNKDPGLVISSIDETLVSSVLSMLPFDKVPLNLQLTRAVQMPR